MIVSIPTKEKLNGSARVSLVVKPRDLAKSLDTTLALDMDFAFPTTGGKFYRYEARIWYTTGATEDFKYNFRVRNAAPVSGAGPQGVVHHRRPPGGSVTEGEFTYNNFGGTVSMTGGAGTGYIYLYGWVRARNGGSFEFNWAQNTSGAVPTVVKAGSYFEIVEVDTLEEAMSVVNPVKWIEYAKTRDESRASDGAVFARDSELHAPVQAGIRYAFRALILGSSHATPDMKFEIDGPASPTFYAADLWYANPVPTTVNAFHTALNTSVSLASAATGPVLIEVHGLIQPSACGELSFRWAQVTSGVNAISILQGSLLELLALPGGG
jgi:hypothetical protein